MAVDPTGPISLRLPVSLRKETERAACKQGVSLQSFIVVALTECMRKIEDKRKAQEQIQTPLND